MNPSEPSADPSHPPSPVPLGNRDHRVLGAPRSSLHRGPTTVSSPPTAPPPPHYPLILALDQQGIPHRWIDWQQACFYYAKDLVAWVAGEHEFTFLGGISRLTGEQSRITANSIIAIRGHSHGQPLMSQTPPLSNRELFHRDCNVCAYCGVRLPALRLTRDHVVPISRGGLNIWMNVVTACRPCNQKKGGRTPEKAHMELLYAPYVPNRAEFLILCNRHILADQMDFLVRHVPEKSRTRLDGLSVPSRAASLT